jgi:photosystem II stability/assembly factor-like uncharacterized protein
MGGRVNRRALRRLSVTVALACGCVLVVLAGLSAADVSVSKSGWEWANPTPQGRTLRDISFAGSTGYAVGDGGTALSTTNAGRSWSGLTIGTTANLESVQALAPSTVVVGGGGGCVTRISEDGGLIFKRIFNVAESACPEPVAAFSFISQHVGFLLLKDGAVEETEDGGESFSRKTGIPGTSASSGGGTLVGSQIHFFSTDSGIAFVSAPENGPSTAYMTPDGGVSWVAVPLPAGARVTSLYFLDEKDGYAVGPNTLLRTTDGGQHWSAEAIAGTNTFTSIDCATATTCLLTVSAGDELIETSDGGETATVKTTSSSLIYGAAYASASDVVAVGENGATVLSTDGGATFEPASADIGGSYNRLREGPGAMLLAPGTHGDFALSGNGGESWRVIATQTSQELIDVSFATPLVGYALDVDGGLQMTGNGGNSWQTLSPGTSQPALGVLALGEHTVLLFGPVGISRAVGGGPFEPLGGAVAKAHLSEYDEAGQSVFAFGFDTHTLLRSSDEGARWSALKLPLARKASHGHRASPGVLLRSVAFTSASQGYLLDMQERLWETSNGGRNWKQILSTATDNGIELAFATPQDGFISLSGFGGDSDDAYVLRTTNGGGTWQPQEITAGALGAGSLVDPTAMNAAALVDAKAANGEELHRLLFATTSGGELTAPASAPGAPVSGSLTLTTRTTRYSRRRLKAAHFTIRITGTLTGALGGETVVVSRRSLSGSAWQEQRVIAGANGGSFSSTWRVRQSSVFVAQWAGGSGRPGGGSKALVVTVK